MKKMLDDKEVYDVIIFGSAVKGKALPQDIDACIITDRHFNSEREKLSDFHLSIMKPQEFFTEQPSLAHALLREGYSLKKNSFLAEGLKFRNRVLFTYQLKNKKNAEKVKIVNMLRGKGKNKGLVIGYGGEWLAKQVFIMPINAEQIIDQFLRNNSIKYTKNYILIH